MSDIEEKKYDVLIIGAGAAGMRAAIAASDEGASVCLVSKSLLGKAHTVMAEGGAAAALGNADERDNWKVHFRDTIKGGKHLNNWKMAKIHAEQAPERILELEKWGAVFDRTKDGKINQRNFGGHRYPRLAHVGDRTGLEIIRTVQDKVIHQENIDIFMECTVAKIITEKEQAVGALAYYRNNGNLVAIHAKAIVVATGGIGKAYRVTSNSWEYTGDGHSLAYLAGADLQDMEFIQFHPTGMVWPPSVKGTLVTEGVRGEGGILLNNKGERFMFNYIPEAFAAETAKDEKEANDWLNGIEGAMRPPELLTRDVVAKAIMKEVKEGRGSPHGGAFLDIANRREADYIKKKLPSMYHQFKELGDLDITEEPMEVGPTTHYMMGGISVNAETGASSLKGMYAAGEAAAGLHGANRLGGNSLSDLLVFGNISGRAAANFALKTEELSFSKGKLKEAAEQILESFSKDKTENPYHLHQELQDIMEMHAGIVREEESLNEGIEKLTELSKRVKNAKATGGRAYNPSWHLCLDMENMIITSLAVAEAARERRESRGGHTRLDYPEYDEELGMLNIIIRKGPDGINIVKSDKKIMPDDLQNFVMKEAI
ncbi:MAG: fumarate reductase/succinate dehydrogenase flavoprotein subunit [Marine Group III euryarchaeote CG-Epi3]|uniref:Fumarate reductase/succinate dehydrogenase flavoprotein subunit n=1 Tax=Marine Group III euryarchaeote CG-Epi3 TaxID=1888997 RepID=A0A1J5TRU7_9ARCH|nr:MAG: fumarate reductase/succinate dehydrogenase flavoprotein subunit [Marine Group III euryarchaeote CG-Epi3]